MLFTLLLPMLLPVAAEEVTIDARHTKPISPYIYGANFPNWEAIGVKFPLARQGGNRLTAYNWETNASNAGNDYKNQNDDNMGHSNESGLAVRTFLQETQKNGAAALLTVPTAGYVSADKNGDGDVNQTQDYIHTRFLKSYARKGKPFVYPPDTTDKAVYQDEFVAWIEKIKSSSTPVWFCLDNEPDIWGSTHSRIWPKAPTYAQIIANNIEFASAIKDVAPDTMIFGPVSYGWQGFRTFQNAPDGAGRDFLDVYLRAMADAEKTTHKRLLDVLDVHWYPEAKGDGKRVASNEDSPGMSVARIQAPRSLWDPDYVEDSWISDSRNHKPIALLPGLTDQIAAHYPGTKLSISEYNYGGGSVVSGLLAQADVLGIFGRYGLFAACNWGISPRDSAEIAAFKSFLDYDGKGSQFGDRGADVKGENPAIDSVYASLDSSGKRLTVVLVNKTKNPLPITLNLRDFVCQNAKSYVRSADNLGAPAAGDVTASGNAISCHLPPLSVTTVEARQ